MSDTMAYVYVGLNGQNHLVGRLWSHIRKGRESASFQYDPSWLQSNHRFSLEPGLVLTEGTFHTETDKSMFGSMSDSAPDRWGRVLMRRAESYQAQKEKREKRTLSEMDYLLRVNDESRQGSLRFSIDVDEVFLAPNTVQSIPPLVDLPRLLSTSDRFLNDEENDEDLQFLLAPGSSLGGARPKASVRDIDGHLSIAKFPRHDDEFSTVLWEAVALTLADHAGINVPKWRLEKIAERPVIIIQRFDRDNQIRIPFLSAMSMIGARDNEQHSYLELVDALRQYGASPKDDSVRLWRRIIFNILISNTDDHLRNHGFVYFDQRGWHLSPAYDMNPTPTSIKPRILTTAIDFDDGTASLELALSVAQEFGLKQENAKTIIKEVGSAVADWKTVASRFGINRSEMNLMASAFEHDDLKKSLTY
jgi:serine/threonine-protein kinase HipA